MIRIVLLFCFLGLFSSYLYTAADNSLQPLKQEQDAQYKRGEYLFKRDCAACHAISMKEVMTAPALAGITKKRDMDWLFRYTKYSKKMKEMNDPIALQLSKEGWGAMPSYPNLNKRDFNNLYYFIEKKAIQ